MSKQFERATQDELRDTIITYADIPLVELAPGAMSHIVAGDKMTLSIANLKADSYFPVHTHDTMEQMMIILSGELDAILDGKLFRMKKGDIIRFPAGHEHGAKMINSDCEIVDIFSPSRPDYEDKLKQVLAAGA